MRVMLPNRPLICSLLFPNCIWVSMGTKSWRINRESFMVMCLYLYTGETQYNQIFGTRKFCLLYKTYIRYFVISVVNKIQSKASYFIGNRELRENSLLYQVYCYVRSLHIEFPLYLFACMQECESGILACWLQCPRYLSLGTMHVISKSVLMSFKRLWYGAFLLINYLRSCFQPPKYYFQPLFYMSRTL